MLRRSVSDGDNRSGNVRLALRRSDLDANLNIHIGNQVFTEFSDRSLFNSVSNETAIAVHREVCEDARRCDDLLPASEEIPFMFNELLQCNQNGKAVYIFTDGAFVMDMRIIPGKMPTGNALFFSKVADGYRLAGMIIQR